MKRIIIGLGTVLILSSCATVWSFHRPAMSGAGGTTLVKLSSVTSQTIPQTVSTTGNLLANQQTNVSPKDGGYIKTINFVEGQYVKAGTILVTLDDSQQRQQLNLAKAQTAFAESTYKRYLSLRKKNIVSPQDIDQYGSEYKKALATQKTNQIKLDDMTITAPIDGYLGAKTISVGDNVTAGQSLVTVTDTTKLKIDYSLPSAYASRVAVGQKVLVTADFLPNNTEVEAEVSYVSPFVDPATQTIDIHAVLPNSKQLFRPGQSVNLVQQLGDGKQALLIPADAMLANLNGNYVFQVKDGKVISTPVTVGEHYNNMIVILKGLNPQDQIVTEGQFQVKTGDSVKVTAQ